MPKARINDIDIYYEVEGEGFPLVLIMGLSANKDWWEPAMLEAFQKKFKVVVFDNRGAGRTDKPKGEFTIALMASDVVGLLKELGMDKAHVLGVSMGGMIAQELAIAYPEIVEKLVLCCTNCGGHEQVLAAPEIYSILGAPREGLSVEDIGRATLPLLFPQEYMEEHPEKMEEFLARYLVAPMPAHSFFQQLQAITKWRSFSRLPEIKSPTLVLTGDRDILIPPENSRILADNISRARLVVFPGGGHGFFGQFPEKVAEEVISFLTEDQ